AKLRRVAGADDRKTGAVEAQRDLGLARELVGGRRSGGDGQQRAAEPATATLEGLEPLAADRPLDLVGRDQLDRGGVGAAQAVEHLALRGGPRTLTDHHAATADPRVGAPQRADQPA